jgi:hypothetical protein
MKGEKNNINYSAEYIRKYLDGQLSDQEMQALEKAALEDPFLSDAIEGIEESRNHAASFESGITDLQKRLTQRIREKNRKSVMILLLSKWKIAASVIFILGIAALTLTYINNNTHRSEIAKSVKLDSIKEISGSMPAKKGTDTSAKSSDEILQAIPDTVKNVMAFNRQAGKEKKSTQKKLLSIVQNKIPDTLTKKPDDRPTVYLHRTSSDTIAEPAALTSVAKNVGAVPTYQESDKNKPEVKDNGLARSMYKSLPGNYIKGIVIDDKGNPIPNAAVSIKGAKKSAVTNQAGFFKLYMIDPEFASQIIITSIGYESVSEEFKPDSSYTNLIQLTPESTSLNEVAVNKISSEPAIGWDAFKAYINSNKKILTTDSVLKGVEVISFVVNKKSELSSFKIEKSLSPAHDTEIIRLIKTAPPLKITKGNKKRLRIRISFN